jgi:hypothetical protein
MTVASMYVSENSFIDGKDDNLEEYFKNIPHKTNYLHLQHTRVYTQTQITSARLHQCFSVRVRNLVSDIKGGT